MEKQKQMETDWVVGSKREHRYDEIRELIGQLTLIEKYIRIRLINGSLQKDEDALHILLDQHRDAVYELGMHLLSLKALDSADEEECDEDEDDCDMRADEDEDDCDMRAEDDEDDCDMRAEDDDDDCDMRAEDDDDDCDMRAEDDDDDCDMRAEDDDDCEAIDQYKDADDEVVEKDDTCDSTVATYCVCKQIHDEDILRELYNDWLNYCDVCSVENAMFLHCGKFYITFERDIDNLESTHIFVPHYIFDNNQGEYVHYACFDQKNFQKLTQRIEDESDIDCNIIILNNNAIATRLNND